ncbi:hypothetical protein BD324DRAFT_635096 [Kockovaella imperatae]|uniref:DUF2264 domain-containing protein n=1 Tax=Kockovaella imperatae TaxID=4999 RepID=A0A1Y1UBD0_9TREE|nr:hypothetical protein BD324DRAFT_635096 [Kockovaella imperatae]ORX34806.1 hypothetical protein BD324DRAFT_635096 [Kockovaella imperatae]
MRVRAPSPVASMTPVEAITSNPLVTREDLVHLLHSLLKPVHSAQSSGGARVHLGYTGTIFDPVAAELEGFARCIWGLAPLLSCEPERDEFKTIRNDWVRGLNSGTNEQLEDEFWGKCYTRDQRFVEMAPIGFALTIAPQVFWDPLPPEAKERLNDWLLQINELELPENNWQFFLVLTNLGLRSVGARYNKKRLEETLEYVECWYGDHGFPSDGPNETTKAYDYYATSFAIPFYTLIYSHLCRESDPERARLYRQRAIANLPNAIQLFAPDGGAIPFGRSMTYRFATSSFWAALAFSGLQLPPPFSLGVIKGLLLRNIRWFTRRAECFARDGSLTIGWTSPSQFMSEDYNSPQSPYWALKSFLVLALPESHPFWQVKEEPYPQSFVDRPFTPVEPWMQCFSHAAGHTFVLSSGQIAFQMRAAAAKYGKFAYSSAFGFSVPVGCMGLNQHAPDSTLALCDDSEGERWTVRRLVDDVEFIEHGILKSSWRPWSNVKVITWLIPPSSKDAAHHTRIHKVINNSERDILFSEGGFAIHGTSGPSRSERRLDAVSRLEDGIHGFQQTGTSAIIHSRAGVSGIIDLIGTGQGKIQVMDGNSNLITPRPIAPLIVGSFQKGTSWLAVRVFAIPTGADGKVGRIGAGWVEEWRECSKGIDGSEGLKKAYPFLS